MTTKNETREKILETASRLFQLQGYHATGLNQIIKESGSPKGSLYYYFPNGKEELAEEAIIFTKETVTGYLRMELEKEPNSVLAIQTFIKKFSIEFDKVKKFEGAPIGLLALETWLMSDRLREACRLTYESFQKVFAEKLMADGVHVNEANRLALVISAMIEGALVHCVTRRDGQPLLTISEHIPLLLKTKTILEE
ncbi:TetR/AcrR family transcriptional regulator [Halalkalibacter urbisdiaboli]|uniref:TetR/AcrR family transcriptional regulator n=1 Tax=Halalkalibacter urbisdiaboli TaxID=1960589 RepID=UPI000B439189|nr:TetR/AcrR family transcriptional regulator [Halalkalibacter urbisdiaboli]